MGQYYTIVNVTKNEILDYRDIDGLKLLEHSYIDNEVAVWLRDKLARDWTGDVVVHIGDYFEGNEKIKTQNWYEKHAKTIHMGEFENIYKTYPYILNLDKKEYVDISELRSERPMWDDDWFFSYDPLLLLTALGNGEGGGDYYGQLNNDKVGSWAGDHLACTDDKNELEGYEQLDVRFDSDVHFDDYVGGE